MFEKTPQCQSQHKKQTRQYRTKRSFDCIAKDRSQAGSLFLADGDRTRYPQADYGRKNETGSLSSVYGWRQFQNGTIEIPVGKEVFRDHGTSGFKQKKLFDRCSYCARSGC